VCSVLFFKDTSRSTCYSEWRDEHSVLLHFVEAVRHLRPYAAQQVSAINHTITRNRSLYNQTADTYWDTFNDLGASPRNLARHAAKMSPSNLRLTIRSLLSLRCRHFGSLLYCSRSLDLTQPIYSFWADVHFWFDIQLL